MSQQDNLRTLIRQMIEQELNEMTATGAVDGFNIPFAFSKRSLTQKKKGKHGGKYATREGGHKSPEVLGYTLVENRWLQIKKNEDMSPVQKIGVGIREVNKQLKEVESFVRWYKRLQTECDVSSDAHWKRTRKHLHTMKERIIRIANNVREIG